MSWANGWKVVKFTDVRIRCGTQLGGEDDDFTFKYAESELLWYIQMDTLNRQQTGRCEVQGKRLNHKD